jgi:hypothetical protein
MSVDDPKMSSFHISEIRMLHTRKMPSQRQQCSCFYIINYYPAFWIRLHHCPAILFLSIPRTALTHRKIALQWIVMTKSLSTTQMEAFIGWTGNSPAYIMWNHFLWIRPTSCWLRHTNTKTYFTEYYYQSWSLHHKFFHVYLSNIHAIHTQTSKSIKFAMKVIP